MVTSASRPAGTRLCDTLPVRLVNWLLDRLSWTGVFLLSLAGAIVAGAVVYLMLPVTFTGQASLLFNDQPDVIASLQMLGSGVASGSDARGAAGALGLLGGGGGSSSQRLEELVGSRRLRRELVQQFHLAERFHTTPARAEARLQTSLGTKPLGKSLLFTGNGGVGMVVVVTCKAGPRLAAMLGRHVAFRPDEASKTCAEMANAIVAFLDRYSTETSIDQARKAREFVEKRTRTAERDLARTEARLLTLQREYRLLSPEARAAELSDAVKTLAQLEAQARVQASNSGEALRLLRKQLPREAAMKIEQTVTQRNPLIVQLEGELLGLQGQLDGQVAGGKLPTHPDVIALREAVQAKQAQLRGVTREIQETVTRGINPTREALAAKIVEQMVLQVGADAGARIAGEQLAQTEAEIRNLPPVAREYIHLERQAQLQGDLLGALQKRLEMARLEEQRESSGKFQVLDEAEPPLRKTGPSSAKAALEAFVGLLCLLTVGRAYRLGWIALAEAETPGDV